MTRRKTAPADDQPAAVEQQLPDLRLVPIGQVHPHPRNIRRSLGDLTELEASIRERGIRNPLEVAPAATLLPDVDYLDDATHFVLVAGHRRYEAAHRAGLTHLPVLVVDDIRTDQDATLEMLLENLQRAGISAVEEAAAYEQLQLGGMTVTQIAKRTGRARGTVTGRIGLLALPESTRDKLHAHALTLDDAAALLEFADDPDTLADLEAAAGTSQWSWKLESARRRRKMAAARAEALAALAAAGVPTVAAADLGGWWVNYSLRVVLGTIEGITTTSTPLEDEETRRAAHATCPHHAALVAEDGDIDYVCTDPSVHSTADDDQDEDDDDSDEYRVRLAVQIEERAQADAAARARREDCATAAALRRQFIVVRGAGGPGVLSQKSVASIALALATHCISYSIEALSTDLAPYLGVDLPEQGTQPYDTWRDGVDDLVRAEMGRRGGPAALLAVLAEACEGPLKNLHTWSPRAHEMQHGSPERDWLLLLEDLGYQLSPWETDQIAAADALLAENDQDDDEDDESDDVREVETVAVTGGVL